MHSRLRIRTSAIKLHLKIQVIWEIKPILLPFKMCLAATVPSWIFSFLIIKSLHFKPVRKYFNMLSINI